MFRSILFLLVLLFWTSPLTASVERQAIARFDLVPYQIIVKPFQVGMIAFHKNGIASVAFSVSDGIHTKTSIVREQTYNKRTGVTEYWMTINPKEFGDGLLTIEGTATPNDAESEKRTLITYLYSNGGRTLEKFDTVYVAIEGSDDNAGTRTEPFASIERAFSFFRNKIGGNIILLSEGVYTIDTINKNKTAISLPHWLTVMSEEGLNRDKVIISRSSRGSIRLYATKVHWKSLSFDFKYISQIFNSNALYWFENCRWFSSDGWGVRYQRQLQNVRERYYATDSLVEDTVYGYTHAELVRNCIVRKISGDVLQNSIAVINTKISNINGTILSHHTDIYQMFKELDNIILYNISAINLINTQILFLEPTYQSKIGSPQYTLSNMAIVNCEFFNEPVEYKGLKNSGGPPWSQFMSRFNHIVIKNLRLPGQRLIFRTGLEHNQKWQARDIVFEDCEFHYLTYRRLFDTTYKHFSGPPEGVTFINCKSASENYKLPIDNTITDNLTFWR